MRKNLPWKFLPKQFGKQISFNKKSLEQNINLLNRNINKSNTEKKTKFLRNYLIGNFSWEKISKKYLKLYDI